MPVTAYEKVMRTRAALNALMSLVGEFDNSQIEVTGWELRCLMEPLEENLQQAEELLLNAKAKPPLADGAVELNH